MSRKRVHRQISHGRKRRISVRFYMAFILVDSMNALADPKTASRSLAVKTCRVYESVESRVRLLETYPMGWAYFSYRLRASALRTVCFPL